ncbi:MAG: type II toxin-antitoxin system RelE/ParE family toxin [Agrococcus sp.]
MTAYRIEILPSAARAIRKLPADGKRRVQAIIELLGEEPRPPAAKKLTARPEWRVRSGDYRVLYRIEDQLIVVVIVAAGRRDSIYK